MCIESIMEGIKSMNPLWAILVVNLIALFAVPFLTYRYAHKNNLKILKEKWISELRSASTDFIEACERLYYANDVLYGSTSGANVIPDDIRKMLQQRREEAQALVTSADAKIRLLFKEDDKSYIDMKSSIDNLIESVDKPSKSGELLHIDVSKKTKLRKSISIK